MTKIISIIAIFAAAAIAQAAPILAVQSPNHLSFALGDTTDFGDKVYYNCQDVESFVQQNLEQLGAKNINVTCTGGIQDGIPSEEWQANVEVTFDSLKVADPRAEHTLGAEYRAVQLTGSDNCELASEVLKNVSGSFSITDQSETLSCISPNDRYSVSLKTLFAL